MARTTRNNEICVAVFMGFLSLGDRVCLRRHLRREQPV